MQWPSLQQYLHVVLGTSHSMNVRETGPILDSSNRSINMNGFERSFITLESGMKKANTAKGMTACFPAGRERTAVKQRKMETMYTM